MAKADDRPRRWPVEQRGVRKDKVAKDKDGGSQNWILMDTAGNKKDLDVDKYAIMKRMQVHARDLRILDPLLSYPSAILSRDRAIVLNLEHIKAIITAEEVLLRDQLDDNVIPVVEELKRRLRPLATNHEGEAGERPQNDDTGEEEEHPFEFTALEVALEAICSYLAARTTELETAVHPAMQKLTKKVTSRKLDEVRKLKSQVTRLTARVQKVRDELQKLLKDDTDLANLYLTKKLPGSSYHSGSASLAHSSPVSKEEDEYDVEELELLLEGYFTQIDETLNKLTMLRQSIDDTEDYINLELDKHRNKLMELELYLSLAFVVISIYSCWAQLLGMSIPYSWNFGHGNLFKWVVIVPGILGIIMYAAIVWYARRRRLIGSYAARQNAGVGIIVA